MTRRELIKILEEADRLLLEEVEVDELTDNAREHAHYGIEDVIDVLKANEE